MFCRKCGCEIVEGAKFCGRCGERIVLVQSSAVAASTDQTKEKSIIVAKTNMVSVAEEKEAPLIDEAPVIKVKQKKSIIIIGAATVGLILISVAIVAIFLNADSTKVRKHLKEGNRYLSELDYEAAVAAFEAVIEIEPNNERAYIGLADAYVGLGEYEKAIEALDIGLEVADSDRLREYRAQVQEQWDDAERRLLGYIYMTDVDLDDRNNEGIPDAYVYVTDESGNTEIYYTNEMGFYESAHLEKGTYSIYFYADGYVGCYQEVELSGGKYEYSVYLEPDKRTTLYGSVQIADADTNYGNNIPLPEAEVTLEKLNGSTPLQSRAVTDENGQYIIPELLMGVYRLTVTKPGYLTVEQNVVVYQGQDVSYNTVIEIIGSEWEGKGIASGTVYDALTGIGVSGLTLKIRKGLNNTEGEVLETFETDESGRYQTPELESGNYCIEIVDDRDNVTENYIGTSINVKILGGIKIDNQDATVSNTILTGQLRIVLTWGEQPRDLDSHLDCTLLNGNYMHIFYADKTFYSDGERVADLDLDDTSSYGPETTTIYRDDPGEYVFTVHNFSGWEDFELARSGACVQVYMGFSQTPTYVFYVPNEAGYWWEVFHYNSITGVLTPINVIEQQSSWSWIGW